MMPINKIVCGDTLDILEEFPLRSIDMVMTSPPYYGLRDYGVDGQIGLEETPEQYISRLRDIMLQIKKILKSQGTVWWNIGDSYSGGGTSGGYGSSSMLKGGKLDVGKSKKVYRGDFPQKCMLMIPERFAFMMVDIGFILRNKIIWHKPNPMPSSVKDRLNTTWEYVYLFSKNRQYYFDLDAIRKPHKKGGSRVIKINDKVAQRQQGRLKVGKDYVMYSNPLGKNPNDVITTNDVIKNTGVLKSPSARLYNPDERIHIHPLGRTPYDVIDMPSDFWRITTASFPEAHFAVYPEELCVMPIKAGCPEDGIVLDPFCGSGTTCVVAKKLGRKFIGIDLNPEYCDLSRQRLRKVRFGEGIKKPKKRTVGKKLKISELKKLKPLDDYT